MKAAMAQKPPETAFLGALVFSARMSAKAAGRKIATAFRRFAKTTGVAPEVKLAIYGFLLRFKRCPISFCHPNHKAHRANPAKGFGWHAEKYGRMAV